MVLVVAITFQIVEDVFVPVICLRHPHVDVINFSPKVLYLLLLYG